VFQLEAHYGRRKNLLLERAGPVSSAGTESGTRYGIRTIQLSTRNWAAVGKRLQKEAGNTVAAQTRAELGGFEAADDEAEG